MLQVVVCRCVEFITRPRKRVADLSQIEHPEFDSQAENCSKPRTGELDIAKDYCTPTNKSFDRYHTNTKAAGSPTIKDDHTVQSACGVGSPPLPYPRNLSVASELPSRRSSKAYRVGLAEEFKQFARRHGQRHIRFAQPRAIHFTCAEACDQTREQRAPRMAGNQRPTRLAGLHQRRHTH